MKKFIGALIIIALIVSLGYVKTVMDNHRSEVAYEKGQVAAESEIDDIKQVNDSLKTAMVNKEIEMADSLLSKDKTYGSQLDSLTDLVESKADENAVLQQKLKSATTAKKRTTTKTPSKSDKIITYYKTRYAQLPADLSEYEKKIAVSEIREETVKKYSITLNELNKLRDKYNLSY